MGGQPTTIEVNDEKSDLFQEVKGRCLVRSSDPDGSKVLELKTEVTSEWGCEPRLPYLKKRTFQVSRVVGGKKIDPATSLIPVQSFNTDSPP